MRTIFIMLTLILSSRFAAVAARMPVALNQERIDQVAAMLPAHPSAIGQPITNRAQWDELREKPAYANFVRNAQKLLSESIPEKTDELYLDFSKTGNRVNWERVDRVWSKRLNTLFLAECLENKGRFLPALEEIITAYCDERSWVMPAHDSSLRTWKGEFAYADLKACEVGMMLAIIHNVVGDRLSPALRARIKTEVIRRNLEPFKKLITGTEPLTWWWITCNNNWNAVCVAGIVEAALALVETPAERALFVVAGETYSKFFLSGFTPDGYCSEGMGYWNYGYGHYLLLTEAIFQATSGKVDLLQCEGARAAARYAGVLEIQNTIHPAFADCSINSRPEPGYMYYLSRRYGFGFSEWDNIDPADSIRQGSAGFLFAFPTSAAKCEPVRSDSPRLEKRTWFPDAGILICRPAPNGATTLAVALKGGHNAEHHNHNDVGSYIVVNNSNTLLIDPGAEVYTRRTFSAQRYESKVLNSFGHSVPLVAGQLQSKGSKARGVVVDKSFTDAEDCITFDITSAYNVKELKSLQRAFRYSRNGTGSFTVTDHVVFDTPQSFETALITTVHWRKSSHNTLYFRGLDEGINVTIEVQGGDFIIDSEVIDEDVGARTKPERIAIRMSEPVKEAAIKVMVKPDNTSNNHKNGRLFNGDFKLKNLGWMISDNMSRIQNEIALVGDFALRVTDTEKDSGSNVTSSRIPMQPGERLKLTGKHYALSGSGLALYLIFYDADGIRLNESDKRGNIQSVTVLKAGQPQSWEDFSYEFTPPPQTEFARIWIHSINALIVDAVIDDLKIE
ncbi:MAG: heparinase II/III family protein [Kiritimatiellae bacterium]|nr:heparinase II/III family protein [Kiritimatiellia bacterium]